MRRSEKPDPTKTYVSWQTVATSEVPISNVLRRGERFPGSHPLVAKRPEFFVMDGEDLESRMQQRLVASIDAARGHNG